MQISLDSNANRVLYYPKNNTLVQSKSGLKTDIFQRSNTIQFKGVEGLFRKSPNTVPLIEILPNVSENFVSDITKQISKFPIEWLKKFKNNNYKIILSPTFRDAYKSQGVFDPMVETFEKQNPLGTLGVTYTEGRFGKNFFAFCDKPPYSNMYMNGIVNHELSHGIVNISGLDKNKAALYCIKQDIELILKENKLEKLSQPERQMVFHYFFNNEAYLPIDEIMADVCAWNKGCGCYGSGLVLNVLNPDLMKNLFPNLSEFLKTV